MADMQHLNGNKLCVLDVETTGLDPNKHDIIEICCIYLDSFVKPTDNFFHMFLTPLRPENIDYRALKANHTDKIEIMKRGVDPFKAADAFEDWFKEICGTKKIAPIGHNYHFDMGFLKSWLGLNHYEYYFDYHTRDTMVIANYLNDRADFRSEKYPYPKQSLQYLCNQLDVDNPSRHTAIGDCLATAECYRKLLISGPLTL